MPASGSARPPADSKPVLTNRVEIASDLVIGGGAPLAFIGGPCVIESEDHSLRMARALSEICRGLGIPFIFKSSFDKANRSSVDSFRGPGLQEGLRILRTVKKEVGIPILSDVHEPSQVEPAADVLDILQIPVAYHSLEHLALLGANRHADRHLTGALRNRE